MQLLREPQGMLGASLIMAWPHLLGLSLLTCEFSAGKGWQEGTIAFPVSMSCPRVGLQGFAEPMPRKTWLGKGVHGPHLREERRLVPEEEDPVLQEVARHWQREGKGLRAAGRALGASLQTPLLWCQEHRVPQQGDPCLLHPERSWE